MKTFIIVLIMSLFMHLGQARSQDLSAHEWKDRLLLILTPDENSQAYREQLNLLRQDTIGLEERKMVIYTVLPNKHKIGWDAETWIFSTNLDEHFRKNEQEFEVILIGLDGGIKLRQSEVITTGKLFSVIDAMPMRRRELQSKK